MVIVLTIVNAKSTHDYGELSPTSWSLSW